MDPFGVKGCVETNGVEAFHWPIDRVGMKFVVGDAPHELESGAPAAEAFVCCVLDGLAVRGPLD